jgi:hypothetical protein
MIPSEILTPEQAQKTPNPPSPSISFKAFLTGHKSRITALAPIVFQTKDAFVSGMFMLILFIYLFIYFVYLFISFIYLFICLFICLFLYLYLFVCLSIDVVYLFIFTSFIMYSFFFFFLVSIDGAMAIWSAEDGQCLSSGTKVLSCQATCLELLPSGHHIACAGNILFRFIFILFFGLFYFIYIFLFSL